MEHLQGTTGVECEALPAASCASTMLEKVPKASSFGPQLKPVRMIFHLHFDRTRADYLWYVNAKACPVPTRKGTLSRRPNQQQKIGK